MSLHRTLGEGGFAATRAYSSAVALRLVERPRQAWSRRSALRRQATVRLVVLTRYVYDARLSSAAR